MKKILKAVCRVCNHTSLDSIFDLGQIPLSGTFLEAGEFLPSMPLNLARCSNCGLVQLHDDLPIEDLYSSNYGYESHLNTSMVQHLKSKAERLAKLFIDGTANPISQEAPLFILDIASNDGTLLSQFENIFGARVNLLGCDPLISNFDDRYPINAIKIEKFFTSENIGNNFLGKLDLVTSLSVFYDVRKPIEFAQDIWNLLTPGGYWHLEQSYFPSMLKNNSYDTICHEHLLYYSANDLRNIAQKVGFNIVEAELNDVNGGSLEITLQKSGNKSKQGYEDSKFIELCNFEENSGISDGTAEKEFADRAREHGVKLHRTISDLKEKGNEIFCLGASTKGNIILNHASLDNNLISSVGEVNKKKFGKVTPGTNIPICDENLILNSSGENRVAVVLPWHFRTTFIEKAQFFLETGGKLIFPLPEIEIIQNSK